MSYMLEQEYYNQLITQSYPVVAGSGVTEFEARSYRGHPTVAGITGITPRIVITRVSGQTPMFVQVSAKFTSLDGTVLDGGPNGPDITAWTHAELSWNFGDTAGGIAESFPNPVASVTHGSGQPAIFDPNTDQTGGEAAYVYRQPGTYPITLSVRVFDGAEMVEAQTTTLLQLCEYHIDNGMATAGTYTLTVDGQTTDPLAYNANGLDVAGALEALSSVGAGNVAPLPWSRHAPAPEGACFEFVGALAGVDVEVSADFTGLTAPHTPQVRKIVPGETDSTVTVAEWTGETRYVDSEAPDGGDGSESNPWNSIADIVSFLDGGSGRRILVKRGSILNGNSLIVCRFTSSTSNRLDAYGEGPDPIFQFTGAEMRVWPRRGVICDDLVCSNVVFDGGANGGAVRLERENNSGSETPGKIRGVCFDNVTCRSQSDNSNIRIPTSFTDSEGSRQIGFWKCALDHTGGYGNNILGTIQRWGAIIGCTVWGGTYNPQTQQLNREHHFYLGSLQHLLICGVDFGHADKSFSLRINARNVGGGVSSEYVLIDSCHITGTENGIAFQAGTGGGTYDLIGVQNCAIHYIPTEGNIRWAIAGQATEHARVFVRDTLMWDMRNLTVWQDGDARPTVYRNRGLAPTGEISFAGFGRTEFGYFRYNQVARQDAGRVSRFEYDSNTFTTYDVDGNLWWTPDGNPIFGETTGDFEQDWQPAGADANGLVANPHWFNAISGDFRVSTNGDPDPDPDPGGTLALQFQSGIIILNI